MLPTSLSLIDRLKRTGPESTDWKRLHDIYLPLIRRWIRRVPGLEGESDDLSQEVLVVLLREVPRFERRREGSFRAWLRQVTVNRVREHWRRKNRMPSVAADVTNSYLNELADPDGAMAKEWEREHDRYVFHRLLALVQPDFAPATWAAFQKFALDGLPAATVAEELGTTENAVLQAKSRILKRLREEAGDILD